MGQPDTASQLSLAALTDEEVLNVGNNARIEMDNYRVLVGRAIAEMHRRDKSKWTFVRLGEEFGLSKSTAHRWARAVQPKQPTAGRATGGDV